MNSSKKLKQKLAAAKSKIVVVVGPTASGKSDLAVKLAKKFSAKGRPVFGWNGAEIISADSRQVYKGLDIGSGKITKKEMMGIKHHLLDVSSPKSTFTAERYRHLAKRAISNILEHNKLPIICGGTGLYVDTAVYDLKFPKVPPQQKLRKKLEKMSVVALLKDLRKLDPKTAERIDSKNKRRLVRALEIVIFTGKPIPEIKKESPYRVLKIGIKVRSKNLKENIFKRLVKRLQAGMIEEVQQLHKQGLTWKRLDDLGLEYRYISRYLRRLINLEQMKSNILLESYRYAKRQMTWFKKDKSINWIKSPAEALELLKIFTKK